MASTTENNNFFNEYNQYLLAIFFGCIGAICNFFPIELAYNISLIIGNTAYIIAASFLRPKLTLLAAFICVTPLYFYWGHPFGFLTLGLEAWFISMMRSKGWYVLTADLLYWLLIGMPLTALLLWMNFESVQSLMLFTVFKQTINAMLYTSLACILLFTFSDYFHSIKSAHAPLKKSLPKWLLSSFWSISAFFVISVSLFLTTGFGETQRAQLVKELEINNNYITHIGNHYLQEHQVAIQTLAFQLTGVINQKERQVILSEFHALYPGFLTMLIATDNGMLQLASPSAIVDKLIEEKLSVADRSYFIQAMKTQEVFVSSVFLGRGFGRDPIVAISAPIYLNKHADKPIGIVEGSLNLNKFAVFDTVGQEQKQIKTIITDQNDRIIYASSDLELNTLSGLSYAEIPAAKAPNLIVLKLHEGREGAYLHKQRGLPNDWKIHSLIEHEVALKVIEEMYLVMFFTLFFILLAASFFAKQFSVHLSRPLTFVMGQLSKAKKTGDFLDVPYETPTEIQTLYRELKLSNQALLHHQEELQQQVESRTKELNQANKKLTEQANTDLLTGLFNRRCFSKSFTMVQSLLARNNSKMMYAIIDLDFFKKVNDTCGHLFGDYCLVETSKMLKEFFNRESDVVARFGGEEFVVISQCHDNQKLKARMEYFLKRVAKHHFENNGIGPIPITISVGVVTSDAGYSVKEEDWFKLADDCLYQAKHNGRNQVKQLNLD